MNGLDPDFRRRLDAFEESLRRRGVQVRMVCGYRSVEEQERLYAVGRTMAGSVVTKARGGFSWHNYGLAADYAFVVDGKLSWEGPWRTFGLVARTCGLEWGGDWKRFPDRPHVQWRGGRTIAQMQRLAKKQAE